MCKRQHCKKLVFCMEVLVLSGVTCVKSVNYACFLFTKLLITNMDILHCLLCCFPRLISFMKKKMWCK